VSDGIQSLELSVHALIKRFIERQQVTFTAFRALRPAIIDAEHINLDEKKLIEILNRYVDAPWQGHWHEWTYYFQGAGCRLIHGKTAEIIEWEASDVNTFDRYWFVNWLEWLWMFHPDDKDLNLLKVYFRHRPNRNDLYEIVFPMLRVLAIDGYIRNDLKNKNMYTLVDNKQQAGIA